MANHISSLLQTWHEAKDTQQWVLATIIATDGSSYRKAGAMMMINQLGQYFGLLSGGCLESDIMRQARRCWDDGHNRIIRYDMREEEDLAWQLGIGCGGMVEILLQPVDADNQYLQLDVLLAALNNDVPSWYVQALDSEVPGNQVLNDGQVSLHKGINGQDGQRQFAQLISPPPSIAIFGGGVDARPVVAIAAQLGWQVYLCDPRSAYAREGYFAGAKLIWRQPFNQFTATKWAASVDAALVMCHNIGLDAEALQALQHSQIKYVGLLGPIHRTERVLERAELSRAALNFVLANPVGLRLGGELPESIALSMLAEVHAFLAGADAQSISGILS